MHTGRSRSGRRPRPAPRTARRRGRSDRTSRDPTTSGHSFRVSELCVGLAEVVDRCENGPYASARFTADELMELRYAALLHDFGKVGVREHVLLKAKKLYPDRKS